MSAEFPTDWDWFEKYMPAMRGWAKQYSPEHEDELFAYITERYPRVYARWIPKEGSLYNHVYRNMKWYMYKWMTKFRAQPQSLEAEHVADSAYEEDWTGRDNAEAVLYYLDMLGELERWIVQAYMHGWSFQQIGDELKVAKGTARNYYHDAIRTLRLRLGVRSEDQHDQE